MIDYQYITDSIKYYEDVDYERIEVPWMVSPNIEKITRPSNYKPFVIQHTNRCLVGSAEQSFLQLYVNESLPLGQFQAVTPCFRDEIPDTLHKEWFIKNELIKTDSCTLTDLQDMINKALEFFRRYIGCNIIETKQGFDIIARIHSQEYELGSYGIRQAGRLVWIYGTGCAEPRLSTLIEMKRNGIS